jgi:putative ABC transport system permease protein
MLSGLARKSVTDLTRRRARTVFSMLTLAIAVASISFFAIPPLIDRAMQKEVAAGRLADVTLDLRPVELTKADLARLAAVPNVAAVEARSGVDVRVLVGERRAPARVIGVRDFARQQVDLVRVESGEAPGRGEVLAEIQDGNVGVYGGRRGDRVTVLGVGGEPTRLVVSGRGRSLPGGEQVQDDNLIVLYAPAATVAALSGESGYGELALRLDDPSPAAATEAVEAMRRELTTVPGFTGLSDLPDVRAPGDWPGKSDTETFAKLLGVITVLALLSALVLVSNTMSTLVAEQTREIGVMRAIGGRRRQVALVYLRTALLLGAVGALAGIVLGVVMSSLLARYFGQTFWAVDVAAGVVPGIVLVSVLVGVLAPALASLPAIRRGLRVTLREALEASGAAVGGQDAADRMLRRAAFLPRVMQVGLRNVGRHKRRSLATALIVALAVGNLLAVLAMARAATVITRAEWGDHLEDVQISTGGRALFDAQAADVIGSSPGVVEAQPVLKNTVDLSGREAIVWAVARDPLFRYRLVDGRWFTSGEQQDGKRVAVVERNIAQNAGIKVGDQVTIATAAGDLGLRVIGIAKNQQENGTALFVPITTAQAALGQPAGASSYWVKFASPQPAFVDHATAQLEERLSALGYETDSEIRYIATRDNVNSNEAITTPIAVLGFVIILISMVGLANAITTNVLERTREIGVLRSIGARARDVRRIFATEGIALAVGGWLLGIPVGYLLGRLLIWLIWEVVHVRLPNVFPPGNVLLALIGTFVLAMLVLFFPVRRAVRLRPGAALRHT